MTKYLKPSFQFFIYSNLFTGLCGCCLSISSFYFVNIVPDGNIIISILASGLFITLGYQFPYILNKNWFTNNTRLVWFSQNDRKMRILVFIEIVVFSLMLFQMNSFQVLLFFHLSIIGWCYYQGFSVPNKSHTKYSLRNLPHTKTLSIGYVLAVATVIIPLGQHLSHIHWENTVLLAVMRIALVCSLCLIFDLRDKTHDDQCKLPTLPVKYGLSTTYCVISILLAVYILTLVLHFGITLFSMGFIFIVIWICLLLQWQKSRIDDFFYLVMVDGTMILPFVIGILFHEKPI